jgi:hypothetical protein
MVCSKDSCGEQQEGAELIARIIQNIVCGLWHISAFIVCLYVRVYVCVCMYVCMC